jgi:hypothetical protein
MYLSDGCVYWFVLPKLTLSHNRGGPEFGFVSKYWMYFVVLPYRPYKQIYSILTYTI